MIRSSWLGALLAMSLGAAALADTPPAPNPAENRLGPVIDRAVKQFDRRDYEGCFQTIGPVTKNVDLAGLEPTRAHQAWSILAICGLWSRHEAEAYDASLKTTVMTPPRPGDWLIRFLAGMDLGKSDIDESLLHAVQDTPEAINSLPPKYVWRVRAWVVSEPNGDARRFALDEALIANWRPTSDPLYDPNALYAVHAMDLVERGEVERAAPLVRQVTGISSIVAMRADRRFDALRAAEPGPFDVGAALERELATTRRLYVAHPERLAAAIDLASELILQDQALEGLRVLDDAAAKIQAAPQGKPAYEDLAEKQSWMQDERSNALFILGRTDDALAVLKAGADLKEQGGANTSQVLNLAGAYELLGRPREALEMISKVGGMSPYGQSVKLAVSVCAKQQLGDAVGAKADLETLKGLRVFSTVNLEGALVCVGDLDGAAKVLIDRLNNPHERGDALIELESPTKPPAYLMPSEIEAARTRTALAHRADVQVAIAKVGRLETQDLRGLVRH